MKGLRRYPGFWDARYKVGAWAFLLHRSTAIIILIYSILLIIALSSALMGAYFFNHVWEMLYKPWIHLLEVIVIGAIAYHALNGIRIILFDLGIGVGKGTQKVIFWALVPVWLFIFAFFFYSFFWRVS